PRRPAHARGVGCVVARRRVPELARARRRRAALEPADRLLRRILRQSRKWRRGRIEGRHRHRDSLTERRRAVRSRAVPRMAGRAEEVVRIAVLNGPSLNLLGTREPAIYGHETLADIETRMRKVAAELHVELEFAQKSGEGELVDVILALRGRAQGALINAGAYSHTSLAIRDAFAAAEVPFVELHLSNIFAREPERR